jgi:hypothetical protein
LDVATRVLEGLPLEEMALREGKPLPDRFCEDPFLDEVFQTVERLLARSSTGSNNSDSDEEGDDEED